MINRRDVLKAGLAALLPIQLVKPAKRRTIDLAAFCGTCWKYDLSTPFIQGDWLYATRTDMGIRLAPEGGDEKIGEGRRPVMSSLPFGAPGQFAAVRPEIFMAAGFCPECNDCGRIGDDVDECSMCNGFGCESCGFNGMVGGGICGNCNGKPLGNWPRLAKIGERYFDVRNIRRIQSLELPQFDLGTINLDSDQGPTRFRFDGGTGLVMPIITASALEQIEEAKGA